MACIHGQLGRGPPAHEHEVVCGRAPGGQRAQSLVEARPPASVAPAASSCAATHAVTETALASSSLSSPSSSSCLLLLLLPQVMGGKGRISLFGTLDEAHWRNVRKATAPAFSMGNIRCAHGCDQGWAHAAYGAPRRGVPLGTAAPGPPSGHLPCEAWSARACASSGARKLALLASCTCALPRATEAWVCMPGHTRACWPARPCSRLRRLRCRLY